MKSLVIDFNLLEEKGIDPIEFLFLYYLHTKKKGEIIRPVVAIASLQARKFVKVVDDRGFEYVELRQRAIDLIQLLEVDIEHKSKDTIIIKKSERVINQELEDSLEQFRLKWKGLRAGAMGSPKSCRQKLTRWMKENPDYTMEQVLKAADMYIASLQGDYRFLQKADYFVFKQENNREESSRLSDFIDEADIYTVEDWTSNLK